MNLNRLHSNYSVVSWKLNAKFPLFSVRFFMGRQTQLSPSMAWVLEDLASSGLASATDCQIANPQAMQKWPHPGWSWVRSWDRCLLSTIQYLFPNDHKTFLCSAETWNPYNIYNEKWKVLTLWLERAPTGLCNYFCAALLALCSVLRYTILFTVSKANCSTVMLLPMSKSYSSILVLKKISVGYFHSSWWNIFVGRRYLEQVNLQNLFDY